MSLPERLPKQSIPETNKEVSLLECDLYLSKENERSPRKASCAVKAEARTIVQYV